MTSKSVILSLIPSYISIPIILALCLNLRSGSLFPEIYDALVQKAHLSSYESLVQAIKHNILEETGSDSLKMTG